MRLSGRIGIVAVILSSVVTLLASPDPAVATDYGCRMSKGYENRVSELQQLLGISPTGPLGPKTCGAVLKLHDVLIESGTIPASQRGLIGPTTFRVLQNPDKSASAPSPAPAKAPVKTDCKVKFKTTKYVACVDVSAQVGSIRSAQNGVIGERVLGPFTLTSSRRIDFKDDTITREGQYKITSYARKSDEKELEFWIPFSGDQGFHFYLRVGPTHDSSGCVRLQWGTAEAVYSLLATSGAIDRGVVEAHIYP